MDKFSLVTSERLRHENIIASEELHLSSQSIKSIFSVNKFNGKDKKFNTVFKNFFSFVSPSISTFNINNNNQLVFWVRSNSYFIISDEIKLKDLVSAFESSASITDQTGGWIIFNIEGKACRSLFEKLLKTVLNFLSFPLNLFTEKILFILCNENCNFSLAIMFS